jgi:hypothetical protein
MTLPGRTSGLDSDECALVEVEAIQFGSATLRVPGGDIDTCDSNNVFRRSS